MKYRAALFDLYGTLLDIHTDESDPILWEKMRHYYASKGAFYTCEELEERYHALVQDALDKLTQKGVEAPECDVIKIFKKLFKEKGIDIKKREAEETATLFRISSLAYVKPYPHVFDLIEHLKANGVLVILVSNAQRAFTLAELKSTRLYDHFDAIYLSSDYKISKPNPEFLSIALKEHHLTPEECLFVGNDHRTDVLIANRLGVDAVYLQTNCSPSADTVPSELECVLRIDDGNLETLIDYLENN